MDGFKVDGLAETERLLDRFPSMIENALEDAAPEILADEVPRIQARAGRAGRQARLAARSVRPGPDGIVAAAGGGVPAAIFYGAEFGGGGRPSTRQFPPHRGTRGYFLFPQLRDDEDRMVERFAEALDPVADRWGRR